MHVVCFVPCMYVREAYIVSNMNTEKRETDSEREYDTTFVLRSAALRCPRSLSVSWEWTSTSLAPQAQPVAFKEKKKDADSVNTPSNCELGMNEHQLGTSSSTCGM
jgi:hypothetical protein